MVGLVVLASAIWLATLGWAVVAWGAFRRAFGVGRGRALLAGLLWLVLLGGWVALMAWHG